jgi:membrane-associated phospholipid phosphatase
MPAFLQILIITAFYLILTWLSRRRDRPERPPGIFYRFWRDMALSLWGWGLVVLLLSLLITVMFVSTGWDHDIQRVIQRIGLLPRWATWTSFMVGNLWTLIIGGVLMWRAKRLGDPRHVAGAAVSLRATFATFYLVTVLKTLSGRRGPGWLLDTASELHQGEFQRATDPADFDLAFWSHTFQDGRFFWPSGHTAAAVTFVSALVAFYPEVRWIPWVGYPLAAFMGYTMIDGSHHWVSDVIAGAAIGHIIGWRIARSYIRHVRARHTAGGA